RLIGHCFGTHDRHIERRVLEKLDVRLPLAKAVVRQRDNPNIPMHALVQPADERRIVTTTRQTHTFSECRFAQFETADYLDFHTASELRLDATHRASDHVEILIVSRSTYVPDP